MEIINTSDPRMYTVPAWKLFKECQIIADELGYGGHWARLASTKDKREFRKLIDRQGETYRQQGIKHYMAEGVSYLELMCRYLDEWRMGIPCFQIEQYANDAIACFQFAKDDFHSQQEADNEDQGPV